MIRFPVFIGLLLATGRITLAGAFSTQHLWIGNHVSLQDGGHQKQISPSAKGVGEKQTKSEVCYGDLGCFSTDYPWTSTTRPFPLLPWSPELINTQFFLRTRRNRATSDEVQIKANDLEGLRSTPFDGSKPTFLGVHGFLSSHTGFHSTLTEILEKDDVNVIGVDWSKGSATTYWQAVANLRVVGAEIAKLLKFLVQDSKLSLDNIHLIGHSLGAHGIGYAGNRLDGIGTLTGLDPAGPFFTDNNTEIRLDSTDAKHVQIIHSYAGVYGLDAATGHVDFFPNGGKSQPGCSMLQAVPPNVQGLVPYDYVPVETQCHHSRAGSYFIESISSECPFIGYRCDSWESIQSGSCYSLCENDEDCIRLGYETEKTKRGNFHFETTSSSPFCKILHKLTVTIGEGQPDVTGKLTFQLKTKSNLTSDEFDLKDGTSIKAGETISAWAYLTSSYLGTINEVSLSLKAGEKAELKISAVNIQWIKASNRLSFGSTTLRSGQSSNLHPK